MSATENIAIIDDDGYIVGIGPNEQEARDDARRFIRTDPWYVEGLVSVMDAKKATPRLIAEIEKHGDDVGWVTLGDGSIGLAEEGRRSPKKPDAAQLSLPSLGFDHPASPRE